MYDRLIVGLSIYCADHKKVIQECKIPLQSEFKWIFAVHNCERNDSSVLVEVPVVRRG